MSTGQKSEIVVAMKQVCQEKNISYEAMLEVLNLAMAAAYRKDFGDATSNIRAKFYPESGQVEIFDVKQVVDDSLKPEVDEEGKIIVPDEGINYEASFDPETGVMIPPPKRFNPKTDILFSDAILIKQDAYIGEEIITRLEPPAEFGRMAAMTAKQVIIQKLREAERQSVIDEFKDKEFTIQTGTVQRIEPRGVTVDIGHTQAFMPYDEQIRRERYNLGDKIKVYVVSVGATPRGPEVIVSRAHPDMVRALFLSEVPEISSGQVVIKSLAREAGSRSKVSVMSTAPDVDPIGACVGQRGSRVQVIISELAGEKIDIVPWSEDVKTFVAASLAPAKVISVELEDVIRKAKVTVAPDQLSLAIGRGGQNVRLASRLTGYAIDIVSEAGEVVDVNAFVAQEREAYKQRLAEQAGEAVSVTEAKKDMEEAITESPLGDEAQAVEAHIVTESSEEREVKEADEAKHSHPENKSQEDPE